jgi:hypothetical protein
MKTWLDFELKLNQVPLSSIHCPYKMKNDILHISCYSEN